MRARVLIGVLIACAVAGCATVAAPSYHGELSDHFDGKRFHNYVRFRDAQIEDALRRAGREILGRRGNWPKWEEVTTDVPPTRVGLGVLRVTFVKLDPMATMISAH